MSNNYITNLSKKKIWVAGHNGMVGSSIVRKLEKEGCDVIKVEKSSKTIALYIYFKLY